MSPSTYVPVFGHIARESNAQCIGLHYRRAPEHPFPAAGDSAGGGLVICALLAIRYAGLPLPAGLRVAVD